MTSRRTLRSYVVALVAGLLAEATSGIHASDTVALEPVVESVRMRIATTYSGPAFDRLPPGSVEALLDPAERRALATEHLRFRLDRPARLYVFRDSRLAEDDEPFWLRSSGFAPTSLTARAYQLVFDAWTKDVPAGEIGLGVHALRRYREHYFVVVASRDGHSVPTVTPLGTPAPAIDVFRVGAAPWVDRGSTLEEIPTTLAGLPLVRTFSDRRAVASLYDWFRSTDHPAETAPDQIVATFGGDPARRVAVAWRTAPGIERALLELSSADEPTLAPRIHEATTDRIDAPRTLNQPAVLRHTVALSDLRPDTRYTYRVGTTGGPWSTPRTFRTAPEAPREIRFLAFGDVQEDYDSFVPLLRRALEHVPEPDFVVFAGDLVSRGNDTDDWDAFFAALDAVPLPAPLLPALGNHELLPGDAPDLYRRLFVLPTNGPDSLEPERAYSLDYAGVRLVVLDSNTDGGQTPWLERLLAAPRATPRAPALAVAHHGAYTSRPGRYFPRVREQWAPLFEAHGVPLVLQGHDHAYLRTVPIGTPGTTYLIATAGGKFYPQAHHAYAARAFADTATFQIVTASPHDGRVTLETRDADGRILDSATLPPPH
jgi:hypothetical protein